MSDSGSEKQSWRFVENRGFGLGDLLAVLTMDGEGQHVLIVDETLLRGIEKISIAVDTEGHRLGVFPNKGDAYAQSLKRYAGFAVIPCSASALQAGVSTGTYALEHGQSGELFFISASGRRGDPLPVPVIQDEKQMQSTLSSSTNLEDRLSECRKFVQKIERHVKFKDRHNGYQLTVPGGKVFGFIRYNVKGAMNGKFVVYTFWPEADPRRIFEPQPGNSNDLHLFFSPDDQDKAGYVVEVLRRAYEIAGG